MSIGKFAMVDTLRAQYKAGIVNRVHLYDSLAICVAYSLAQHRPDLYRHISQDETVNPLRGANIPAATLKEWIDENWETESE
jgi:hypothetical protein